MLQEDLQDPQEVEDHLEAEDYLEAEDHLEVEDHPEVEDCQEEQDNLIPAGLLARSHRSSWEIALKLRNSSLNGTYLSVLTSTTRPCRTLINVAYCSSLISRVHTSTNGYNPNTAGLLMKSLSMELPLLTFGCGRLWNVPSVKTLWTLWSKNVLKRS